MLSLIVASVALLFVHIGAQAIAATSELGSAWNAGPRDEGVRPKGVVAGRAERALRNYLETYPAFVALAAALVASGRADGIGFMGAVVWLIARIVYIPLYLTGIPYWRSLVWLAAVVGLALMAARLLV
ncbi:MAPEG family protein [Bosea sp. (in: a-proteobacteria)]|jgi:uncharacterized MAPEG superfamily protein|uniref:MAPEG family protein n=1 Tax=Bosea sp. (in: a-proteobacteria) TaxID=1871050 RepID=UPI002DDD2FD7|nr:MAPEG family protein [Bosea sp. (in: a-proteobacteria)]HEV2511847.1 MAPEG family protein [Bosea sp. (in: a-proteobacteria)]